MNPSSEGIQNILQESGDPNFMHLILTLLYYLLPQFVKADRGNHIDKEPGNETLFDLHQALWAFEFAAAAYAEDPTVCLRPINASLVYRVALPCDYLRDECWGFVATREDWIIVAFRGTRTKVQLITELIETMSEPKKKLRAGGSVQHYFYVALQSIWKQMYAVITKLRKTYPTYRILFTGHSLGGALASLASTLYAHRHPALTDRWLTFQRVRFDRYPTPVHRC
ncbi:triacylglycerol lipase [Cooperia oncophora]